MDTIKFGTDGWRAIIADTFTVQNVKRVAWATAKWLKNESLPLHVVVGYDCRFAGQLFAEETACIMASEGIRVSLSPSFVSTPMISLAAHQLGAGAGIILTASHNPPAYNGFKIKAHYGGPASPAEIDKIESWIPDSEVTATGTISQFIESQMIAYVDFEKIYLDHCAKQFDMNLLQQNAHQLAYDAMFGAGQNAVKTLLPAATFLHAEYNPSFLGRAPEPIAKNLPELSEIIAQTPQLTCGLATDGDADRIGFFDQDGQFVDSHHLILLLMEYLSTFKGYTGKVVKSFSVSDKVQALADHLGLETITTKIGFKYICEHMVQDDVLIGAEESGGIAIKGHIPERDGVWMGLVIMEYCAKTGKTVKELILDIYDKIGSFAVERYDLHLDPAQKDRIVGHCQNGSYHSFGSYTVSSIEDTDGYKFRLNTGSWVMIRPSGTEPVLRVYSEASNSEECFRILDATRDAILA